MILRFYGTKLAGNSGFIFIIETSIEFIRIFIVLDINFIKIIFILRFYNVDFAANFTVLLFDFIVVTSVKFTAISANLTVCVVKIAVIPAADTAYRFAIF